MAADLDTDLVVDVAIVGGGLLGHYLAQQLHDRFSVCVVDDPQIPTETLDARGYLSAGYDGNDVARIQPARRAAGYWKLWAESRGVAHDDAPALFLAAPDEVATRTRLWTDAALTVAPDQDLPEVFAGGSADQAAVFGLTDDVVIDPAAMVRELHRGLEDRCLEAKVVRFDLASDQAIDSLVVDVGAQTLPLVPRFTVFAADSGNAGLLHQLAARLRDTNRRREATELARTCQAVRKELVVCIRGYDLPLVAGYVAGLSVAAHPLDAGLNVWLVSPAIDDGQSTLGAEDLRFEPPVDPAVVAATVKTLFGACPELEEHRRRLEWGTYVRRQTEHPMMAVPDTSSVGQPSPARIDTLGLDGFLALWPSHLSYAMVVGDVAAERIAEALRGPGEVGGPQPAELAPASRLLRARWAGGGPLNWHDWPAFATLHGIASA